MEPSSGEDLLQAVLDVVARRGSLLPQDWSNVLSFVSLRSPDSFNAEAFKRLQYLMRGQYGLELTVVGGAYGCFKLLVRVTHTKDMTEAEIIADEQPCPDLVGRVLESIMHSSILLEAVAEAGLTMVQTREKTFNVRTAECGPGHGGEHPIIIVNGPVGSIGNENTLSNTDIGYHEARPVADGNPSKPEPKA